MRANVPGTSGCIGGGLLLAGRSTERVIVFIDWQNVYRGARDAFHHRQAPGRAGMVDPRRLASRLIEVSRGRSRKLAGVRVYRGRPDPTRDPIGYAANQRQQGAWEQAGVTVVQRPLRHPKAWPAEKAQEKGVDVALAVDFVMLAVTGSYDVGILCSTDTDLKPALEAVVALGRNRQPHCEVAAWASSQAVPRLRITGARLWCHYLRVDDYLGMVDPTDYTTR
jgi:uncharacterized LabA/DUF88 family protein